MSDNSFFCIDFKNIFILSFYFLMLFDFMLLKLVFMYKFEYLFCYVMNVDFICGKFEYLWKYEDWLRYYIIKKLKIKFF